MNLGRYYFIASTFSAARMGIGATSVLYMLSFDIELGDIALIKIVQALIIFFAEVPTGIVSDHFGRKASILFAGLSAILSFVCFIFFTNIIGFAFAEVFNALAISFWSGAFEALAVDNTQADKKENSFIEYFFQKISKYSSFSIMISGLVGGMLGEMNLIYPFYFSIALMLLSMASILIFVDEKRERLARVKVKGALQRTQQVINTLLTYKRNAFKFALSSEHVKRFFIIQICIQFALQPVFHYWQPYFKSLSTGENVALMGYIFFGYVFTQTLFSAFAARLYRLKKVNADNLNFYSSLAVFVGLVYLSFANNLYLAIVVFCLLQGSVAIFRNNIGAGFNRFIPSQERSTILSSVSFISRLGMFGHLAILKFGTQYLPLPLSYLLSAVGFLIILFQLKNWRQSLPVHEVQA